MADDAQAAGAAPVAPATSVNEVVVDTPEATADEVVSVPPEPEPGWVKHIASGTYHEVDDRPSVHAAYPGQYEDMDKAPGERSTKIGWPKEGDAA